MTLKGPSHLGGALRLSFLDPPGLLLFCAAVGVARASPLVWLRLFLKAPQPFFDGILERGAGVTGNLKGTQCIVSRGLPGAERIAGRVPVDHRIWSQL